ncbi:MAG: MBL fold metallo-hydrolase [Solirubrobacteraceae bacterium]
MFFRQVLYRDLGCASYVLGDGGEAIVVDPRFDIDVYVDIAREQGLQITHVLDTHEHADHISGRERLAALTGAHAHRPAHPDDGSGGDLADGTELRVGRVLLRAIATPGHRPEHLAFVVSDAARSTDPWMLLSGDSLLVGDLARPDLAVDAELGAHDLHASLRTLLELGDHVEVWPGHVGGSLCGGENLSLKTSSTIGYERRNNPLLSLAVSTFVPSVTGSIPARPPNVAQIVQANCRAHEHVPPWPPLLDAEGLLRALDDDVTVLDARDPRAFDDGHIAGALNLPVSTSALGTRAGWALRPHDPIVIVADERLRAEAMTRALHAVGLWRIVGIALDWTGLAAISERAWSLGTLAAGLRERSVALVDVREPSEWRAGHVDGSIHLPLGRLGNGRDLDVPAPSATVAVACAAGARAAFAASLLRRGGWQDVVRIGGGGISGLSAHGIALVGGAA